MNANAMKVLADALRDALPEQDAADVLRWAEFPQAVRTLIEHQRLTGDGRCVSWVCAEHELDRAHTEALGEAGEREGLT